MRLFALVHNLDNISSIVSFVPFSCFVIEAELIFTDQNN
uniref:Uncharacterized protein n=1 Tax=Anopheles albimanus TaxID=7167 RepID=A0A182FYA0_ANOAL